MKHIFKKKIFEDAILYTIANAIIQASSLVGVLFVARYLGPTNLGLYSFAQNYIAAFVTLLSGIDMYAHWHIVKSKEYYYELLRYTKQKAYITLILIVFFVLVSYSTLPTDIFVLSLLLIVPLITSIFSGFIFVSQYQNKTKLLSVGMVLSAVLILILKLLAVYYAQSLSVFVAINSLDGILLAILCVYTLRKNNKNVGIMVVTLVELKELVQASIYPLIYIGTWFVVTRADQFFVPVYFNAYTLGVYSAAVKVIEMTNVLIVIMQSLIIPRISQIQNPESDIQKMHLSIAAYGALGVCAAALIYITAPILTHILFGPEYTDTIEILRVYAWSIPGLFINYLFVVVAMSKKSYKQLAILSSLLAVLTLSFSFIAARGGSVLSVATVSVCVYTVAAAVLYIAWRKKYI